MIYGKRVDIPHYRLFNINLSIDLNKDLNKTILAAFITSLVRRQRKTKTKQ